MQANRKSAPDTFSSLMSALGCGFNRSMQHLVSKSREEDVADEEVPTEDSLHRNRQGSDVPTESHYSGNDSMSDLYLGWSRREFSSGSFSIQLRD